MTMLPMYKKCSRCKRKYSWNPDVGKMWCPYCGPLGQVGWGDIPWKKIGDIHKGKKNKKQYLEFSITDNV